MEETTFDVYCRASEEGSSDTAEQEAEALRWADRHDVEIGETVEEVASGALAAGDRELERLISRCERGESAGIIVFDERRFARDVIAGATALARLEECSARLVATRSGFDSRDLTPEARMQFNIMMAVGQAELERNRLRRKHGKAKAARLGVWCATPPAGYDRDDSGRLVPNGDADVVRDIYRRRAAGEGFSAIARALPDVLVTHTARRDADGRPERVRSTLTRSAVRKVVLSRVYLGEQKIPHPERRGEQLVIENSHPPLVTEPEWEAANAVKGRAPERKGLSAGTLLKGLIRCGPCRRRLHVLSYGSPSNGKTRSLTYACTGCGKVALVVDRADSAVMRAIERAAEQGSLAQVIERDRRYDDALQAVSDAKQALADYRDNVALQQLLGIREFAEGLRVRKEAVETARRALRDAPRPRREPLRLTGSTPFRDVIRHHVASVVEEVLVHPRSASAPRLAVRWAGEDTPVEIPIATRSSSERKEAA